MKHLEFLIPRRPLSLQAKKDSLQKWKIYITDKVSKTWRKPPISEGNIRLSLIYLCGEAPPDIDNIIKPIQDALAGLVYEDDNLVTDVDSHRRFLDSVDLTELPDIVINAFDDGKECVYVSVQDATSLEVWL